MPAPAILPVFNNSASASLSMIGPRAQLIRMADSFIKLSFSREMVPRVESLRGR